MTTWQVALVGLAAVLALMTVTWAVSLVRRDASLVDRVWGPTFVVYAWVYVLAGTPPSPRSILMAVLVTVWALRLAAHITWRNWGKGEDPRYRTMRERAPQRFALTSLVTVFWLQALIAWVVSVPLLAVATADGAGELTLIDGLGIAVWAVGLYFEAVGDWQLSRFLADPANRGKVMDGGLWRYTRHPNYFGDTVMWWGLFLLALAAGTWWAVVGPLVMTVLIVRVSGVALTERSMSGSGSKREGHDDYVRRTNAFIPGPPSDPGRA